MKARIVPIKIPREPSVYDIRIGSGLLAESGRWARSVLKRPCRIKIVSDPTVFALYGDRVLSSLSDAGFAVSHFLMDEGERHKNLKTAAAAVDAFSTAGLTRTDAVAALGGGVVGDLAGFAAATHLRGIRFLQIPTSLLAMIDSSVGGKTGVNTAFGKNLLGSFHQPSGVLIDVAALGTLPAREVRAGLCEMIKHGALSGRQLLLETHEFLARFPTSSFADAATDRPLATAAADLIAANVAYKASVVAADEYEGAARKTASRKFLNLGHTLAHALEKVTNYRYFRHGEAVGYGILFAAELSKSVAGLAQNDVQLLYDVVHSVGKLPPLSGIDRAKVIKAFDFDKKNLDGSLHFVLLRGIGRPVLVSQEDIPRNAIPKVLEQLFRLRP